MSKFLPGWDLSAVYITESQATAEYNEPSEPTEIWAIKFFFTLNVNVLWQSHYSS